MFGLKRLVMSLLRRYDKKASKTLQEPILASITVRNLRFSRNPKEWLVLVGSAVMSAMIPIPPALDRLVDVATDVVDDIALETLSGDENPATYVDVDKRFRMGEELYVAVTPTRFAILRLNAFTFNAGQPLLVVSRRAVSKCGYGDKLSFLRYPYTIKLALVFADKVPVWFGVHRWFRERGKQLYEELAKDQVASKIAVGSDGASSGQ